jgi:hypothetical protein
MNECILQDSRDMYGTYVTRNLFIISLKYWINLLERNKKYQREQNKKDSLCFTFIVL